MDVEFRELVPEEEEIEAVARLEKICFSDPWSEKTLRATIENRMFYLPGIFKERKPVGYAVLFCLYEESELQNLAVCPDERRQGLGDRLLKECFEEARRRGAEKMYLEVRESNRAARALYEKNGFEMMGLRKNYYRSPTENALLMVKYL